MHPPSSPEPADDALLRARAVCLHDLSAAGWDCAPHVDLLDAVLRNRRWWVQEWPAGVAHLPGQVAQDLQDALLDAGVRWPACPACAPGAADQPAHELRILPDLGPDPHWVCEVTGTPVSRLGSLPG